MPAESEKPNLYSDKVCNYKCYNMTSFHIMWYPRY